MKIAAEIVKRASARGQTITCAESCTGGMISAALTDIPGSSAIFERGFVTYSNTAKTDLLGVAADSLAEYGAVSEQVVEEMALGALKNANADFALAVSGIAGPGGSEHKPEGRVCFALATPQTVFSQTRDFGALGRDNVRAAARDYALQLIYKALDLGSD